MTDRMAEADVRMGRRERRKIATRSELVRAGRELYGERGLYDARIEDLAERAGIAKGTVYLYFRSKEEHVQAVVEDGFTDLARHVSAALSGERKFPDLVARIVDAHLEYFAANPDRMRLFHQARGILLFRRPEWIALRKPLRLHIEMISRWLARAPSPLRERSARREMVALMIFAAISGATSVRAALAGKPSSFVSATALKKGIVALVMELARGAPPPGGRGPGGWRT